MHLRQAHHYTTGQHLSCQQRFATFWTYLPEATALQQADHQPKLTASQHKRLPVQPAPYVLAHGRGGHNQRFDQHLGTLQAIG